MNTVTQQVVDGFEQAGGADVAERISDAIGFLADYVAGATKAADHLVRENPWRAIGAVALAAIAVGIMVSQRARANSGAVERGREMLSEVSGG